MVCEKLVRLTLVISCIFDLVVSPVIAFPQSTAGQILGLPSGVPLLYGALLGFVILLFGLIYGWLATRPSIDQPLLFVSAVGKVAFLLIISGVWLAGQGSGVLTALAATDVLTAILWFWWLGTNLNRPGIVGGPNS